LKEHGPTPRKKLRNKTNLSESNLSHMLRDLEEADLIEREVVGREVLIRLGPAAEHITSQLPTPAVATEFGGHQETGGLDQNELHGEFHSLDDLGLRVIADSPW
jgi:DNA-binding MarR family transcriptional regulator